MPTFHIRTDGFSGLYGHPMKVLLKTSAGYIQMETASHAVFFIRFLIFALLISLAGFWADGSLDVKTNTGGFIFNVLFYSILRLFVYFLVFLVQYIADVIT
jgi:hypothetical protein